MMISKATKKVQPPFALDKPASIPDFIWVATKLAREAMKLTNGDTDIIMSALMSCIVSFADKEGIPLLDVLQGISQAHVDLCDDDIISQAKDNNGHFVLLKPVDENTEPLKVYVHDIVCETFVGPRPSEKHVVKHIDGNVFNNAADNLAWTLASN
jgi:hypothetical protein